MSDIDATNSKYDKLKVKYDELDQDYMKSRLQFGDIKEDLTQKNIILTDKLNKLKEDYDNKIEQLKEKHTIEIDNLNHDACLIQSDLNTKYQCLSIEKNQIDKELAVAKSELVSKDNIIKQLEDDVLWLKPSFESNLKYQNRIYELQNIITSNGFKVEDDKLKEID